MKKDREKTATNRPAAPRPVELLAPARDAETAIQAILHGADAVYMGPSSHGARRQAGNSLADLERVARFAHRYGARLYATVNTLVYESELEAVRSLVWDLWRAGTDALIVQDTALLAMDLPPIALHASTQCDTRDPAKARFLQDAGFSQIVLPREMSLDEIAAVRAAVDVPLEVFVHGALCVSYSGDCQASYMLTGRSANRGECAQVCRFPFNLEDGRGNVIIRDKHLLSLRDMNRSARLAELLAAGASSFKIEGRLKDAAYVKNVVAAYRRALDAVIDAAPGRYRRSSLGRCEYAFTPDLGKSFNRGYTPYFLTEPARPGRLATFGSPKWIGEEVGTVLSSAGRRVTARLKPGVVLANGDGLGYYDRSGAFAGFRLNRVEQGGVLFPAAAVDIPRGAALYRNADAALARVMAGDTATRLIPVSMTLRPIPAGLALDITDPSGMTASASAPCAAETAKTPQLQARARVLAKLGGTCYTLDTADPSGGVDDRAGDMFVPASVLAALRRDALAALDLAREASYRAEGRRPAVGALAWPGSEPLSRHDNVANSLARKFYTAAGASVAHMAAEVEKPLADTPEGEVRVMETRYCLRRELGACLRQGGATAGASYEGKTLNGGRPLPADLYLTSVGNRFRLRFCCDRCVMRLYYCPK